jgi:hypothetical protein
MSLTFVCSGRLAEVLTEIKAATEQQGGVSWRHSGERLLLSRQGDVDSAP